MLQTEIWGSLARIRRAENLVKKHRKKEQMRFYKDLFKFVKGILIKEKSGSLLVSKADLEKHLKKSCTDNQCHKEVILPPDMPPTDPPEHQIDISPPRWSAVQKTLHKATASPAPGHNGVLYRLYKNTLDVLRFPWKLMKVVWQHAGGELEDSLSQKKWAPQKSINSAR